MIKLYSMLCMPSRRVDGPVIPLVLPGCSRELREVVTQWLPNAGLDSIMANAAAVLANGCRVASEGEG